jgi:hypothetical protein
MASLCVVICRNLVRNSQRSRLLVKLLPGLISILKSDVFCVKYLTEYLSR